MLGKRSSIHPEQTALVLLLAGFFVSPFTTPSATAQPLERWFQVEISIFSNESQGDRSEEQWQADQLELDYPDSIQRLKQLSDLLLIDDLIIQEAESIPLTENLQAGNNQAVDSLLATSDEDESQAILEKILAVGPAPATAAADFKFFDFQRDSFLQLPPDLSDFQQTNRAIERAADHRLLFHSLWRQPMQDPARATPIYIEGGLAYGEQHELQGNITIRFNDPRDRIVIDTDLWLAEFSAAADQESTSILPDIPAQVKNRNIDLENGSALIEYGVNRVFHLQQSRNMRSTEFHYLDHPAMGVIILVIPYEVPELPLPEFDFEQLQ